MEFCFLGRAADGGYGYNSYRKPATRAVFTNCDDAISIKITHACKYRMPSGYIASTSIDLVATVDFKGIQEACLAIFTTLAATAAMAAGRVT